jgi:hypothetical protein
MPPQFCLIGSVASFVHSRGISSFVRMYYANILQCSMIFFCHLDVPSGVLKRGYSSRGTFSRDLGK